MGQRRLKAGAFRWARAADRLELLGKSDWFTSGDERCIHSLVGTGRGALGTEQLSDFHRGERSVWDKLKKKAAVSNATRPKPHCQIY